MNDERLKKQIDFILEIDKEKEVYRQTHVTGYKRFENDAEHAWHMAIMLYLLREHSNEPFDIARAMMMALIHDVVEIDAGDTYAYDEEGKKTQAEREARAAERIFGLLPKDQKDELHSLFIEFEECKTPEARIARAMDNLQPLLLNDFNGGKDWRVHDVSEDKVIARQERSALGSKKVWELSMEIIKKNTDEGNLKK